ncbi:CAP-gly domain-containing linker protein 1 [Fasciola hepatica]|uniref:CAP-gly domain-containing linker protein 1 n=1 Tax=Fasciola hepatica TaxID=6192 RepID=A0A4E0QUP4_FASHE|nr:CAP-gly domain-containing linker protein 1 [Fasciola hepatica]
MNIANKLGGLGDESSLWVTREFDGNWWIPSRNLEDLQFRMEEENINKSTLEPRSADEDSRVFELEEALMSAREINEQTEAELARVQAELAALRTAQSNKTSVCPATEKSPLSVEKEHQKGDTQIPSSDDCDPQVRKGQSGSARLEFKSQKEENIGFRLNVF